MKKTIFDCLVGRRVRAKSQYIQEIPYSCHYTTYSDNNDACDCV